MCIRDRAAPSSADHSSLNSAMIYPMIKSDVYKRQGLGTRLISAVEEYCCSNKFEFLTVKTLADTVQYDPYERTRRFYHKMGFVPLEIFPLHWDEENPCLFMADVYKRQYVIMNLLSGTKFKN